MNHLHQCYFFGFWRMVFSLTLMFSDVGDGSFFRFRLKMFMKPKLSLSFEMTTCLAERKAQPYPVLLLECQQPISRRLSAKMCEGSATIDIILENISKYLCLLVHCSATHSSFQPFIQ